MARDVGCQRYPEAHRLADMPQQPVSIRKRALVILVGSKSVVRADDGENVRRPFPAVFLQDPLDARLDLNNEPLLRLASGVTNRPAADVALAQVRHIDKGHPACTIAKEEEVSRQLFRAMELHLGESHDGPLVNRPLRRPVNARINSLEGKGLHRQSLFHRLVVNRPQVSHVERYRIPHDSPAEQPITVFHHQPLVYHPECYIIISQIRSKAAQRPPVSPRRPPMPALEQLRYLPFHKFEEGNLLARLEVLLYDVIDRILRPKCIEHPHYLHEQILVAFELPPGIVPPLLVHHLLDALLQQLPLVW